jgi:hypothetical protein
MYIWNGAYFLKPTPKPPSPIIIAKMETNDFGNINDH